jgi:peptidoglycan/xylan/chitin deacetylase (PgdA/CDA1 family)
VIIGVLVALILVTRALADRGNNTGNGNSNANAENADLSLLNIGDNANTNANANTNSDLTGDTGNGTFPTGFLADYCAKPLSEYGTKKLVVLTFDAGAGTASADQILAILKAKGAPAGAFLTGEWAEQNPAVAKSFADAGLGIYSHSYDHPSFVKLTKTQIQQQLSKAESAIKTATGVSPKPIFRPPFGDYDDSVVATVRGAGYCPILWTVDALDWQDGQTADAAKARVLSRLKPGAIVLMQVGDDVVPQFLADLIDEIRAQGYTLVGLPTLFSENPVPVKATNTNANTNSGTNKNVNATNTNSANKNSNTNSGAG